MQVDAVAALAPVLARFAIVVDGPLEAEVLGRLVTAGDRPATLADLARPFPGRPDLTRPDAVAVARGLVTRLLASGTVEHVAGGYRVADPALAAHLRGLVQEVTAVLPQARPAPAVTAGLPAAVAGVTAGAHGPVAAEEASRLLQQVLVARSAALPAPAPPRAAPVPDAWGGLVRAGWTPPPDAAVPGLVSSTGSPVLARVVVADPASPPAAMAARLGTLGPTHLAHVAAPPVTWGEGDPVAARAAATALGQALAAAPGSRVPAVLDRALAPALAVLAADDALPQVLVVDLRSGVGRPVGVPAPAAGPVEPSLLAAAMAGAAGARAPTRRPAARVRARGDLASLLEVLFGPRCAEELLDEPAPEAGPATAPTAGVVVTARTDDPQADALGALLGVEVLHLEAGEDLLPEVLAWLEDEDGRTLLAPQA